MQDEGPSTTYRPQLKPGEIAICTSANWKPRSRQQHAEASLSGDYAVEAAVQHAVAVHKHQDTPDLRQMIKSGMKDGTPPIEPPRQIPESI
jgi:hypothetical protein